MEPTKEDKINLILQLATEGISYNSIDKSGKGGSLRRLKEGKKVTDGKIDLMYSACLAIRANEKKDTPVLSEVITPSKINLEIEQASKLEAKIKALETTIKEQSEIIAKQEATIKDQAVTINERDKKIRKQNEIIETQEQTISKLQKKTGLDIKSRFEEIKRKKEDGLTFREVSRKYNLNKYPELLGRIKKLYQE